MKNFLLIASLVFCVSCAKVNVFEKNITIRDHLWASSFKPAVQFEITDTTSLYNIYIVIRHSDVYRYNNLWLKCYVKGPEDTAARNQQYNLPLANNQQGWYGTSMDDITEARILIQPDTRFSKTGMYHFTLEQTMRLDPLPGVLNAGVRIEKKP